MELALIYHFQSSQNQEGEWSPASYRVVYFFSEKGFLETEKLKELSKCIPEANHERLTFLNLDDLKTFSLRVCEHYEGSGVRLISGQDYNIGLDGAGDLASFKAIFQKYGEVVENELAPKKKGFFGKFFS